MAIILFSMQSYRVTSLKEIPIYSDFVYCFILHLWYALNFFGLAAWTDSFQHIVDAFYFKSVWQFYHWCRNTFQAVCMLAFGAEKVGMLVVVAHAFVVVVVAAGLVFYRTATVVNLMNQVVLAEKGKASKYGAFIYCF